MNDVRGLITDTDGVSFANRIHDLPQTSQGVLRQESLSPFSGDRVTEALCVKYLTGVHLTQASIPGPPGLQGATLWAHSSRASQARGRRGRGLPSCPVCPNASPGPPATLRSVPPTQVCAVFICRLRRQQGQTSQLLDTEGRAGSQTQGKLQDGCNNNILGHACSRGCSS